jgi:hypothetical protein
MSGKILKRQLRDELVGDLSLAAGVGK